MSSAVSSISSSSAPSTGPITQTVTHIGGTFVAEGEVDILLSSEDNLTVQTLDKSGMTLYVFANDEPGESACTNDTCISAWPPLLANEESVAEAPLTIVERIDGHLQWALRDKPLYFFVGDTNPGDLNGEGVNSVWHVALYEPVLLNSAALNENDGDYFVASGNVSVGVSTESDTSVMVEIQNRDGFSLYTFDNDTDGVSNCSGVCVAAWPPLLADANEIAEAPYTIIERNMGTAGTALQWAYHGKPLYFFSGDTIAGETNGKAIPNWRLARPLPTQIESTATLGSFLSASGLVKHALPVEGVEQTSNRALHGFTLYTFDNDTSGVSNCADACLTLWPALMAHEGAVAQAPYSLVERSSGEMQWALNGMPLYFYSGDSASGDTNGEGFGGNWYVARLAPVAVSDHPSKGILFMAHGNIVNAEGAADNSRLDFTLYTFDVDPLGETTCFDDCLIAWPALYAPDNAQAFGDFTVIVRDENTGVKQWAYKGKPLYFYIADSAPGHTTGEYTDWTIARP
jgi:predicted lipoprotein with Yx(FWY)xxD motif